MAHDLKTINSLLVGICLMTEKRLWLTKSSVRQRAKIYRVEQWTKPKRKYLISEPERLAKAGRGRYPNKDCNIAVCPLCIVKMMTLRVICIVALLNWFAQITPCFALCAVFDLEVEQTPVPTKVKRFWATLTASWNWMKGRYGSTLDENKAGERKGVPFCRPSVTLRTATPTV